MSGYAGAYFNLLQQFDSKAIPQPTDANTLIQKVAAPSDGAAVSDIGVIVTTIALSSMYGSNRYAQCQYHSYGVWVSGVFVNQNSPR